MDLSPNPTTTNPTDPAPPLHPSKRSREARDSSDESNHELLEQVKLLTSEITDLRQIVTHLVAEIASLKQAKGPLTFKEALTKPQKQQKPQKASKSPQEPDQTPTEHATSALTSAVTSAHSETVTEPQATKDPAAWTTVGPKKASRTSPNLAATLKPLSKEEKLKLLLKKPTLPEDRANEVASVMVKLPLSTKAQRNPITAWKAAVTELTGHQPLAISLVNPCKAEVFFDAKVLDSVSSSLHSGGFSCPADPLADKDLVRRKTSYLRQGYFLPLRRSMLLGFSQSQQLKLLELAETSCQTVFTDPIERKKWKHHCQKDREWVQQQDDPSVVDDPNLMAQ
jgi:hypothetical protein